MFPKMEVIISAVMIELANRSISFLINKWSKLMALNKEDMVMVHNLRRLLLQAGVIVDEAEGRCITNPAMLHQLNMMRKEVYRGYYMLDTFLCQDLEGDKSQDTKAGHSFTLSRFNPAKRLRICSGNSKSRKELMRVLGSLETTLQDAAEFIMLSGRYPQITRQPYNMYLLLDNCMFGRQKEMEHILNFLLQSQSPSDDHLGVLPVIGPRAAGKSTLVEHVCIDERVHRHFSRIVFLTGGDLRGEHMATLQDGGMIKYNNRAFSGGKVLIIVELDGDLNEGLWQRLYSASRSRITCGSKIIITSRSNKIASFGTTESLRVLYFAEEAFWYFFKVRMFGSTDIMMENPKLASLAMDMAREIKGCFIGANIIFGVLKYNVDIPFWNMALAIRRIFTQKNPFVCDLHPVDPWVLTKPILLPIAKTTTPGHILVHDIYQTPSSQNGAYRLRASAQSDTAAPMVTLKDLIYGNARPPGNFHALAWRSHIPPHYNCVFKCESKIPQTEVSRKKRTQKIAN